MSEGLRAEAKALQAVNELQKRNWSYKGVYILKAARTYNHPEKKIRRLDSKKIDLIIAFGRSGGDHLVFVLQVKSTVNSYNRFRTHEKYGRNIKCILVEIDDTQPVIMDKLRNIFMEVLDIKASKNRYLRRKIPVDLL